MEFNLLYFQSSIDLSHHPILNKKKSVRKKYYRVLEYFVSKYINDKFIELRLEEYRNIFLGDSAPLNSLIDIEPLINTIIASKPSYRPFGEEYKYYLFSDIALIILNSDILNCVAKEMSTYLKRWADKRFTSFVEKFINNNINIDNKFSYLVQASREYFHNISFAKLPLRKILVTANMSAGKSTLINSLIGAPIVKMSQEVCTGNIAYVYNKPFEDGLIHMENIFSVSNLEIETTAVFEEKFYIENKFSNLYEKSNELVDVFYEKESFYASYFLSISKLYRRLCIIDTPGVNSTIHSNHGEITRNEISKGNFDKLLYVLNANKLGTNEEIAHLKWISEHVNHNKIIFAVNKIDDLKVNEDNLLVSLEGIKADLKKIGFEKIQIYPISAYYGYLLKMEQLKQITEEDDIDLLNLYKKRFSKSTYDVSDISHTPILETDNKFIVANKQCGLFALEQALFK